MENLEVQLGAEIKELQKKLGEAEKTIKNFGIKADKNLGSFSKSSKTATKSVEGLEKGTASGVSAMTAFSRTIQDAPFGIMGVSNNITNLTEQFGYLKTRTGSAGGALRAMLKDLAGFGGITFAISAVTSLLLVYGDEIEELFDSTSKLTKENKALTESTKGFIGTVGKEITSLNVLLGLAKDETVSKQKRTDAVKKLNELFPEYLGNLKLEGVNSKTTANQVDELTKSLVQQATVKGLLGRISEIATKKFEAEQKQAEEYVGATEKIGSAFSFLFSTSETYTTAFGKGVKKRNKAIGEEEKKIESLQTTIQNLLKNNSINFDDIFGGKGGGDKSKIEAKEKVDALFEDVYRTYDTGKKGFQDLIYQNGVDFNALYTGFDPAVAVLKDKMMSFSEEINSVIQNNVVGAFSGIGNAIGNAMSGAGNLAQNLGASLLGSLGGILTQLGTMALTIGISLSAIKKALVSLNPALAIGAGVALIALGSYFSSKSQSIGSSVGGGSSTNAGSSSSGGGASFSGGSSISGSSGGTVVFEIAGQKLVGVLSNTLKRNKNLGGSLSLT